jgi:hypothetical protein
MLEAERGQLGRLHPVRQLQFHGQCGRLHRAQGDAGDAQGRNFGVVDGMKAAARAVDRHGIDRRTTCDPAQILIVGAGRLELDHGKGRHRLQVVRPQALDQSVGQFRQFVVELLTEPAGDECEAFEHALDVGVAARVRQHRTGLGMDPGILATHVAQPGQLILIVGIEGHSVIQCPPRGGGTRVTHRAAGCGRRA